MLLHRADKMPPVTQWPRGPQNALHDAVISGSTDRTEALLSTGIIDIDQGTPKGATPLVIASGYGHSHAVRILLNKGANVSIVADDGITALHCSAQEGHLATSKMLVEAGADLEAATTKGGTPLHLAAEDGHSEVMGVLIEAGANPDSRNLTGATPLYSAAQNGHMDAIKVLLRAKANPLLTSTGPETGTVTVPLDMAAQNGHLEVVRELVQQVGIEGCGGASGGVTALALAAKNLYVDIMTTLTEAGVVDTGTALVYATAGAREASVKYLLQKRKGDKTAYVNFLDSCGFAPLPLATGVVGRCSPRIARLLVDAGAEPATRFRLSSSFIATPLELTTKMLRTKKNERDGTDLAEEQLHRLEGVRRLLLRVEAVHAAPFLYPVDAPSIAITAEGVNRTVATSTPLRRMLPLLRRRARGPRVLLAALYRNWEKP